MSLHIGARLAWHSEPRAGADPVRNRHAPCAMNRVNILLLLTIGTLMISFGRCKHCAPQSRNFLLAASPPDGQARGLRKDRCPNYGAFPEPV